MNTSSVNTFSDSVLPRPIRFWLLLIFDIPSVACSLFLFYNFAINKPVRSVLTNHVVIVLLMFNFVCQVIDTSSYLNYLRVGFVWPSSPAMCIIWTIVGYEFYASSTLLVALASIERHIFIFHSPWIATHRQRLLVHYLPLILLILYCLIYGIILLKLLITDGYAYDYNQPFCGSIINWIQKFPSLSIWDLIVNEIMPTPIIAIFNIALLVRVLVRKRRMTQSTQWRKQRKMIVQMLSISSLFLLVNFPPVLEYLAIVIVGRANLPGDGIARVYLSYITYYQATLLPFVCLGSLPEFSKKLIDILPKRTGKRPLQKATAVPMNAMTTIRI